MFLPLYTSVLFSLSRSLSIPNTARTKSPKQDPLGLGVGEFYSRLVAGMLNKGTPLGNGDGASPAGPVPTFSALQPWLEKIKNPALACTTAQRVAASMTRYNRFPLFFRRHLHCLTHLMVVSLRDYCSRSESLDVSVGFGEAETSVPLFVQIGNVHPMYVVP